MDMINRLNKICALLQSKPLGGSIDSKKKFHKLVYLLQQKGEDFDQDFIFHYYGVFSPSLARDMEIAKENGWIEISEPDTSHHASTIRFVGTEQLPDMELAGESESLLKELAGQEPRLLEVLSTIVYLHKNYFRGEDLKSRLRELKPDRELQTFYESAFRLAKELYGIEA
jgi:uncharacterized protein YwgA